MKERFVISDTHFGHKNIITFKRGDGTPLRPFSTMEEMHDEMIRRWNETVPPTGIVYVLGDVVINKKYLPILNELNGSKRLIMGNHDIFGHKEYLKYFKEIYGVRVFVDEFIFSHIPLHPDCVSPRFKVNVHGHLHHNQVMGLWQHGFAEDVEVPDPNYLCVCVERTDFRPISFDEVKTRINHRRISYGKL